MTVLLLALAAPAWAEWVKYEESDGGSSYFDPASIRKRDGMVRVWELTDLKKRSSTGALSNRALLEYDCKEERYRILSVTASSGQMASGEVLLVDDTPGPWSHIAPRTIADAMQKLVCK